MTRSMAAFAYFALYCVVALLPLQVALVQDPQAHSGGFLSEWMIALGLIAYSLILLELALVARIRSLSENFGTDALLQFHRQFGLVAGIFVMAHTLALAPGWGGWSALNPATGGAARQSGALAFWALALILSSSIWRRVLHLSYDAWRRIHRTGSVVLLVAASTHILSVSQLTALPALDYLVVLLAVGFGAVLINYMLVRPLRLWRQPWRVATNQDIGSDTRLLELEALGHCGFRFEPGQFAWLISGRTPYSQQQHPITIASSAEAPAAATRQSFAIKRLGDWSRDTIPALRPGQTVWLEGPYGALSVDRIPAQGFVLIAGGIGITPMRSILLTLRDRGDLRPCLLFYAVNDFTRMIFREELLQLSSEMNLKLIFVLEHPQEGDVCERGRIDTAMLQRHLPRESHHFQFLVCGPNPMMDSIEQQLSDLGIPDDHVHSERFNQV